MARMNESHRLSYLIYFLSQSPPFHQVLSIGNIQLHVCYAITLYVMYYVSSFNEITVTNRNMVQ